MNETLRLLSAGAAGLALGLSVAAGDARAEELFVCPAPPTPAERLEAGTPPSGSPPAPVRRAPQPLVKVAPGRDIAVIRWLQVDVPSLSEELPIRVEAGTVGLTIRAVAPNDDALISVELLGPTGELLACEQCGDGAPAVGQAREGRGTTQMPSTDRPGWELVPGEYAFRVRAIPVDPGVQTIDTVVNVTATLKTESVKVARFLDLNFVYLPGCSITTEIAETSPDFTTLLEQLEAILAPLDVRVGDVTHVDADPVELGSFARISTWAEAGRLFRTSGYLGRPRALNVYCVESFDPPLSPAVGLSGGVPGAIQNGTRDSGIIMRTVTFPCCLGAYASLFAHEIGHYLGMYHTTEANFSRFDPFSDTPECPVGGLGSCPDRPYVMFPVISEVNVQWSPAQAAVAASHPYVRSVPVVTGRTDRRLAATASPQPFRESVRIRFASPVSGAADVNVHDVRGRLVASFRSVGGEATWDGRTQTGEDAPAGVYFVRIDAEPRIAPLRVVRVR